MRKIILFVFICIAVLVIVLGNVYWNDKLNTTSRKAKAEFNKYTATEELKQKEKLKTIEVNKNNSVIDWLKYLSISKDTINISILGSSVTQGAGASDPSKIWGNLISNYLHFNVDGINTIKLFNNGYGGYSTPGLIKDNKVAEVAKNKPDVVIFELCLINNFAQNVPIPETKNEISSIINQIHSNLPNTLIVLQTANPISRQEKNGIGLTYDDYNQTIKNYVQANNWNFINTNELYKQEVKNIDFKNYLKDGIHPNDEGNKIWFNILKDNLSKTPANM